MSQAVVAYGIGATKAGTSWLHRYLSSHPECHFRAIKELHYFDAVERGFPNWISKMIAGDRDRAANRGRTDAVADHDAWLSVLNAKREDDAAYLSYLNEGQGNARVVGDVTPAYALLPGHRLKQMAALAPRTKFIFLMRDPLDRLWSNIRMMAGFDGRGGQQLENKAARLVEQVLKNPKSEAGIRSDYVGMLRRIRNAVPGADLLVEFYERLFTPAAVQRICEFLGLSAHPADFDTRVHAGRSLAMAPAQRAAALQMLAPQYAHVATEFPDLPPRWQAHLAELGSLKTHPTEGGAG
ncbi:MAG TPA: sulfotransferase [Aliiroseovarius sp.]|nr:sulfotransferase [Aliiroseovarius sp.]